MYVGRIHYAPPQELPDGWWDALQTLACWVRKVLRSAYESGYDAGKLDALRAAHSYYDDPPKGKRREKAIADRLRMADSVTADAAPELEAFLAGFRKPSTPS